MAENKRDIDFNSISSIFGLDSDIYKETMKYFEERAVMEKDYENKFEKWKKVFHKIYGKEITSELFLRHSYFALILKILIICKSGLIKNQRFEEIYGEFVKKDLDYVKIFNYNYLFWCKLNKELFKKIYDQIKGSKFAKQDLFTRFYQQIFITNIRHKIGEFFTPLNLVQKMIDDFYGFGSKILDPSCGSGSFLVNIIVKILDSTKSRSLKARAIANVYGFDLNPLAIMTAKANIFLLLLEHFSDDIKEFSNLNIFLIDSLFPESYEKKSNLNLNNLYNSFDLVIGNPPWLTYKDLDEKQYQIRVRELSNKLSIKPSSQYITHIELAAIFYYAIPLKFLKQNGKIFFVMPKSVLNGDHCHKFRAFSFFNKNLEIWDFPKHYFFNVNHICLKAEYIGKDNNIMIPERYPIKTKLFNNKLELKEETFYSSVKIENDGAKLILPKKELEVLSKLEKSPYKEKFFQGATLVPRALVFIHINEKQQEFLVISSDLDILSRAKRQWEYSFHNKVIEPRFQFKTFLNIDLIPFYIKSKKNVFLPVNKQFDFDSDFLQKYPKALSFYQEMNEFYQKNKKEASTINTLFANLNYWNKLRKQVNNKSFIVVYNASGSNLKAAVINNQKQKVIIGSENYYYSTDSENEAYYLTAILNAPILSKNIKLVKSSRHIHKRPFMFPIPLYDKNNVIHGKLTKKGKKCQTIVQDLFLNNPKINSKKVRIIINQKLLKLDRLTKQVIFN